MKIIAPLSISHESEVYVICGISCSVPKLMHVYFTRVNCLYFVFYLVFLFLFFFFLDMLMAYGSSWARNQTRATAMT